MKTKTARTPRPWPSSRVEQLTETPGARHDCPVTPGLFMRVSPKLKAVWAYRFKHNNVEHSGTIGAVLTVKQLSGISYDDARQAFSVIYERATSSKPRRTLGEAYADWLKHHPNRNTGGELAPRTLATYQRLYTYNLAPYAEYDVAEAGPLFWRDVLQPIRDRAPHQARQVYMLLHSIYGHLVELKVLPESPIQPLGRFFNGRDLKKARQGIVPLHALGPFLSAVRALRKPYQDAPLLLAYTGWRMAAVLRMAWADVDMEMGVYTVPEQGEGWKGYTGTVALSEQALALLRARKEAQRAAGLDTPWVFPARHGDKGFQVDVSTGVRQAGAAAGAKLTPHDLRRTWTTLANLLGLDALTISRLTGRKHAEAAGTAPAWGTVLAGYVIQQIKADRAEATLVCSVLRELGGLDEPGEKTRLLAAKLGFDLAQSNIEPPPAENESEADQE